MQLSWLSHFYVSAGCAVCWFKRRADIQSCFLVSGQHFVFLFFRARKAPTQRVLPHPALDS